MPVANLPTSKYRARPYTIINNNNNNTYCSSTTSASSDTSTSSTSSSSTSSSPTSTSPIPPSRNFSFSTLPLSLSSLTHNMPSTSNGLSLPSSVAPQIKVSNHLFASSMRPSRSRSQQLNTMDKKPLYRPSSPSSNSVTSTRISSSSVFITFLILALFGFSLFFAKNIDTLAFSSFRSKFSATSSPPITTNLIIHSNSSVPNTNIDNNSINDSLIIASQQQPGIAPPNSNDPVSVLINTDITSNINKNKNNNKVISSSNSASSSSSFSTEQLPNQKLLTPQLKDTDSSSASIVILPPGDDGRIGWNRSWPVSEQHDTTGLYELERQLKLDNTTLLNYFHLHKTGGVSVKASLLELVNRQDNLKQLTKRGTPVKAIETCYQTSSSPISDFSIKSKSWRCDFRQIRDMGVEKLKHIDLVLGHQYWEHGSEDSFGNFRDIQYFSILRHPLSRKLSFYYHFFVRNLGLDEHIVPRNEVLKFVLNDNELLTDARMRDAGPNYYASRFISDGISQFNKHNKFIIENKQQQDLIIRKVTKYIDEKFIFIGLQTQNVATICMMEKTVQVFAHTHGIDTLIGTPAININEHKNSGDYYWTAGKLWASMSQEEKKRFNEVERVDLAIYKRALERFRKDVKTFKCDHKVNPTGFKEEQFE